MALWVSFTQEKGEPRLFNLERCQIIAPVIFDDGKPGMSIDGCFVRGNFEEFILLLGAKIFNS